MFLFEAKTRGFIVLRRQLNYEEEAGPKKSGRI